jgi:hypothetical protein
MSTASIKKQVDNYLPLLTIKQQTLVLEMIKNFLNVDGENNKRLIRKQYNKELKEAEARIEKGRGIAHKDALKKLSKW